MATAWHRQVPDRFFPVRSWTLAFWHEGISSIRPMRSHQRRGWPDRAGELRMILGTISGQAALSGEPRQSGRRPAIQPVCAGAHRERGLHVETTAIARHSIEPVGSGDDRDGFGRNHDRHRLPRRAALLIAGRATGTPAPGFAEPVPWASRRWRYRPSSPGRHWPRPRCNRPGHARPRCRCARRTIP